MSEIINGLTPGVPLTEEQKENLRKENEESSREANRLATERRQQDMLEGKGDQPINTIAEIIRGKLNRGEFTPKPGNEPKPENL